MFGPDEDPVTIGLDNVAEPIKIIGRTPVGGQLRIEYNTFGTNKGHNDVIDADSRRVGTGPILQMIGNVFHGAGDELLDLGGDVYVAGNLFQNVTKDEFTSDRGYASVISTGDAGTNTTIVVARNVFYNIDHGINLRNSTATIFEHNTVVQVHPDAVDRFGELNRMSAVNLFKAEPGATPGKGAYVAGNIFWDGPRVFGNVDQPEGQVSQLQFTGNLLSEELAASRVGDRPGTVMQLGPNNRVGDPRLADPAAGDFRLLPGSAATNSGVWDLGALVPEGAWIRGEPHSPTSDRDITLTVGGPGIFFYRYRVNGGQWSEVVPIGSGFDPQGTIRTDALTLQGLGDGEYTVEVIGQDFAGNWQATPTQSRTWTVGPQPGRVVLNELLAANQSYADGLGFYPDLVELRNPGDAAVNLRGYSLTDDPTRPQRFVFSEDRILPAGGYLTLSADDRTSPGIHLGFSLRREGESLMLFAPESEPGDGQQQIDAVTFGWQIGDYSLGRVGPEGEWTLTEPTFGQANRAARLGDTAALKINEWLAGSETEADFVELYNADSLPVALGGLYLSDAPDGQPQRHEIPAFSYVAAREFRAFWADGDPEAGADHVDFRLDLYRGTLGLHDADGVAIDTITYGSQTPGISQGRQPDGAAEVTFFVAPSPDWRNGVGSRGDLNEDGRIDAADIDQLAVALRSGGELDEVYDLNRDAAIDSEDYRYLIQTLLGTTFGDADLDGDFGSTDFVQVFQIGEYEDDLPGNSTWSDGDWDGNGEFDSQDIVIAFQYGRYSVSAKPPGSQPVLYSASPAPSPSLSWTPGDPLPLRETPTSAATREIADEPTATAVSTPSTTRSRFVALDPSPTDSFFVKLATDQEQADSSNLGDVLEEVLLLRAHSERSSTGGGDAL